MIKKIKKFFEGHERSVKAKKNIVASFLIKGVSMVVGFLLVRVTIDYLNKDVYGIWLTLTSLIGYITFFEIGLGNGLKNKLAEALAVKDYALGKIYVSTTYAILGMVILVVATVFFVANFFIDWTVVLNTDASLTKELRNVAFVVFGFFFVRFLIQLMNIVLLADQRPAVANLFGPIGNLMVLIIVYILTQTTEGSLIYVSWVFSGIPVLVLLVASIYFYSTHYKHIAPSFKSVNFGYARNLLNLGVQFFFIQIAGLIIYQSSNLIIAQYFGTSEVTVYNIGYKYFQIITMIFSIILTPFWAAYTEAWAKDDIQWIKNSVAKLLKFWMLTGVVGIVMLLFADKFYYLWVGDKVKVPFELSLTLYIYFMTYTFGGIYVMFINGVGKIKIQMYSAFLGSVIFIVASIVMIKYLQWGMKSLLIAMILSNFNGIILSPIQYKKIINKTATGLWNK
ncbi:oligosaccharide flippase family protein [Flavobacteriaceae bacterium F08102]|nr:oligosaccharide flippase family protein [Flavobacteriaceae bacterium F08102]